jgi:hypothetical protein
MKGRGTNAMDVITRQLLREVLPSTNNPFMKRRNISAETVSSRQLLKE